MDAEQSIAEIEWLGRIFAVPDTRLLSASEQPVVSALAALWCLLPLRVANTPIRRNRQLAPQPIRMTPVQSCILSLMLATGCGRWA